MSEQGPRDWGTGNGEGEGLATQTTPAEAQATRLHLFEGVGVELEYMLVAAETLDVLPVADRVLRSAARSQEWVSDLEEGPIAWSNELVLHVLELKTNGPAPSLVPLAEQFAKAVRRAAEVAAEHGAILLPTAMHPWMDPARETVLWPHEYSPVYEAYDRIFGCSGHGWSNLQSAHLNLPFADDLEFGRLHAGIRLVLPLLPALAASSPLQQGQITGFLDTRLEHYRTNSRAVPSVAGAVVPEPIATEAEYRTAIFERIWSDLAPHDPQGVLQDEFANSRGAIARFERGAIEIRVVDVQECPRADVAIVAATLAALRVLVSERHASLAEQLAIPTAALAELLWRCARDGERAAIDTIPGWRQALGLPQGVATAGAAWVALIDRAVASGSLGSGEVQTDLAQLLHKGPLARRILAAVGDRPTRRVLESVYRRLGECLLADELFG